MKYYAIALAFLAGASQIVVAQTYGLGNTNPAVFSQFRIPKTDLSALWMNTNLNYHSDNQSLLDYYGTSGSQFTSNLSAGLSPQYLLMEESDNRYLNMDFIATGQTNQQYTKYDGNTYSTPGNFSRSQNLLNFSLNGTYRDYDASGDVFWSLKTYDIFDMSADYGRSTPGYSSTPFSGWKIQNYSVGLGVGVGKMRNVTAVVSAIRFQQRLKQLNLLKGDLSEGVIEDLAQQFYREGYYGEVHVRPDKFFWQDVQSTLSKDGVSLAGLDQYADSYLREIPGELRFMRKEGAVMGVQLQLQYGNQFQTISPGVWNLTEDLVTLGDVYFNYSHQLNLDSQLSFDLDLSGGPNVLRDSPVKQQYAVSADAAYDFEMTDRLVFTAYDDFSVDFVNMGIHRKGLTDVVGASFNYFVEDHVSLSASYTLDYFNNTNNVAPVHGETVDNSLSVGLTYYIDRGFMYI